MLESTSKSSRFWTCMWVLAGLLGCDSASREVPDTVLNLASQVDDTGSLPVLEPALSAEETTALREAFSWDAFDEVAERDDQGRPALFYTLLYLEEEWQLDYVRVLGLHHSFVPLFEEERARWAGQAGVFSLEGDREGVFLFTLVPGRFLNLLREAHAAGESPFGAVVLRAPPEPEARAAGGSVSYDYLGAQGFAYGGAFVSADDAGSEDEGDVGSATAMLVDTPIRVLRAAVSPLEDLVDEVRAFFGEISAAFDGKARVTVSVMPLNTDNSFGLGTVMRRGWGLNPGTGSPFAPRIGEPMFLRGARIQSHKGAALFRGQLNANGRATFEVAKGRQNLCVELANDAAEVTNFLNALVLCNFNDPTMPDLNLNIQEDTIVRMDVQDYRVNIFAQMQDGYDYMRWVIGRAPRQVRVITGFFADIIGEINGGRAFAPCLGNSMDVGSTLIQLFPILGVILPGDVDIAFPFDQGVSANSRGVPTHEYGHFVSCDLMHATNAAKWAENWFNVVINTLGGPGADNDSAFVHEAFADFITMQIVGGANYPALNGSRDGGNVGYCPVDGGDVRDCAEDNVGGPSEGISGVTFNYGVARVATLLQDAFDGARTPEGQLIAPPPGAAFPFDGTNFIAPVRVGTNAADEEVVLPGPAMRDFFRRLFDHVSTMNERNFNNALARTALQYGHSEEQVCEMFSLHAGVAGVPGIPGTADYMDCRDMVDEDALSTVDLEPSAPEGVRVIRDRADPSMVTIEWTDLSLVATGFEFELTGEDGTDRSQSLPYARSQMVMESGLSGDTEYTATVTSVNESQSASTTTTFVTFAFPPTNVMASPGPGSAALSWTPPERASGYEISRAEPDEAVLFSTTDPSAEVRGLSDAVDYRFGVASLNRLGEPGERVLTSRVRPETPAVFYVAPGGSDSNPMAGTLGVPFATISAAVAAANARDADAVWVLEGAYTETAAIRITTDLDIIGGFARGTDGSFIPGTGTTTVSLTGTASGGAAPRTRLFNFSGGGRAGRSGVIVATGADAFIAGIEWTLNVLPSADGCYSAMHVFGALTLDRTLAETFVTANAITPCVAGLMANVGSTLRISNSELRGFSAGAFAILPRDFDAAGVASQSSSIDLSDTTLTGVFRDPAGLSMAPANLSGLTARVNSLRASRVTMQATNPVPWRSNVGSLAGMEATVRNTCVIDNSVFRGGNGGNDSYAITVHSSIGSLQALTLAHVTAVVGTNWPLTSGTAPDGYEGAAIRVSGSINEFVMANSILSFAGGARTTGVRYTALDISGLNRPFTHVTSRGNVFSVPLLFDAGTPYLPEADGSLIYCSSTEFGRVLDESGLNGTLEYQCPDTGGGSTVGWDIGNNRALLRRPQSSSTDSLVFPHVIAFDDDGKPAEPRSGLSAPVNIVRAAGVRLSTLTRAVSAPRDRGGVARSTSAASGAGAWIP